MGIFMLLFGFVPNKKGFETRPNESETSETAKTPCFEITSKLLQSDTR